MGTNAQQYCLRWNNHQTNLLTVFDELLQNEAFTDVTLICEGGSHVKCHRMVLAACSPYFQNIFTVTTCKHPVVVLDVKLAEIKAILEYMYRGEVNVAHDQLAALLKVAETFKVKGLVEESRGSGNEDLNEEPKHSPKGVSPSSTNNNNNNNPSNVHSSSSNNNSPPHSTNGIHYKNHYNMYAKGQQERRMSMPMWTVPGLPMPHHQAPIPQQNHAAAAAMLNSCYEAGPDMNSSKRKKSSSLGMNRDTPILRTVLGLADSSQPVSLVCHGGSSSPDNINSNGIEERHEKHIKNEPSENAQSPYTDLSMMDDDDKLKMPPSSPHAYPGDVRGVSGIATYVPSNQKPEWKRYKQYTRNDILSAIEAVKNGMSALQAAKKYGVPSRTLYDKVKKLGITPNKHFKRGSNGSSVCFPYGISGTSSPYMDGSEESMNNNSSLLEANSILQHALDSRGGDEREALAAMAAAAAAHAALSGHGQQDHNLARSPSPSPTLIKYMRMNSLTPSPAPGSEHNHSETNGSSERDREEEDDHVEDLSVSARKHQESRVIMPPMSMSSIIKKEEMLKETLREEMRREVSVENAE
ncbi:PREDICTED: broad-complex core protein [Nicrophorus vespilloides]|uniref:Broad-complex core protein n=1 Tax=Nicrophorus vespilloides TaxID=110193 RepID=A0ABM1M2V4_NICVS|nr:PREDICTED: broad-complex core protein [Nicrophorus vespilloides]